MSDEREEETAEDDAGPLGDLRRDVASRRGGAKGDAGDDDGEQPADQRPADSPRDDAARDRTTEERSSDGPLENLRQQVESRSRSSDEESEDHAAVDRDALFTEMDVDEVDSEEVWADLLLEDGPTEGSFPPTATERGEDATYQVVTKRLCHRCEFFGDPPTLHCTHEGTTIHELVDMDHYRVSECPMVDADENAP